MKKNNLLLLLLFFSVSLYAQQQDAKIVIPLKDYYSEVPPIDGNYFSKGLPSSVMITTDSLVYMGRDGFEISMSDIMRVKKKSLKSGIALCWWMIADAWVFLTPLDEKISSDLQSSFYLLGGLSALLVYPTIRASRVLVIQTKDLREHTIYASWKTRKLYKILQQRLPADKFY